ncbi:MAG: hypothetical protein PHW69_06315, partial [Elusimicrobiaceae bacterium]|nr:hypothetical protein [Elusimicrobiaceae bacterium]
PSEKPAPVKFGTSGHRGELGAGFCALHARAIAQAVARLHKEDNLAGPVVLGGDTRLMAGVTAEICAGVLAGNGLKVILPDMPLPTPVFSAVIRLGIAAAGLNGTASHNPPADMGLKYNPAHGGPADSETTARIQNYANECLADPALITEMPLAEAVNKGLVLNADLMSPYLDRLAREINFAAIRESGVAIGIHPLGGTSLPFYREIKRQFALRNVTLADSTVDPTFGFIPRDHDGRIRMDPSSQYPMRPLLKLVEAGTYQFAGASDPDADRFGVATERGGLINPNHALCVALDYLLTHRPAWPKTLKAARSIGTTHLLDRIAAKYGRSVYESDVGFKHFVKGLDAGEFVMAGEESAGLSAYGWTTEKDGIYAVMLFAEITAQTGQDISSLYNKLTAEYGTPRYRRTDVPVTDETRARLKALDAQKLAGARELAGEPIVKIRDTDGVKVYTRNAWVLARLSGTEPIAKLYAESFLGAEHLERVLREGAELFGLKF